MTILLYPNLPGRHAVISKICAREDWQVSNDPAAPFDLAINWEDTTFRTQDQALHELTASTRVLNSGCTDISKRQVDQIHRQVFGYGLTIDPATYSGPAVQKSDLNAAHDGSVVLCPIPSFERDKAVAQGSTFSRLLNTVTRVTYPDGRTEECVQDIRVPYFNGDIPFCYLKYRPVATRFSNANSYASLVEASRVLTAGEQERIRAFCQEAGFDYGELDVLRNLDDGKMYIVDMNTTPSGPPNHLGEEDTEQALVRMTAAFKSLIDGL